MNKNLLINGNFDLWQRGVTFSILHDNPLSGSTLTAPNLKIADRWYLIDSQVRGGGSTGQITAYKETFSPSSPFYSRSDNYLTVLNQIQGICGGYCHIEHKEEDCTKYANLPLVLTFLARTTSGVTGTTLSCYFRQVLEPNSLESSSEIAIARLTSTWQNFSYQLTPFNLNFSGISGDDYFSVGFRILPEVNINLASVSLRVSETTLSDTKSEIHEEKSKQEKYYKTSYKPNVTAGSVTLAGNNDTTAISFTTTPNYSYNYHFDAPMRKTPQVTLYSPKSGTQNDAFNKTADRDMRLTSGTRGWNQATRFSPTGMTTLSATGNTYGVQFNVISGAVIFDDILVHVVADADIDTSPNDRGPTNI